MNSGYYLEKSFDKCKVLTEGEYENCVFNNCDLDNGDLSGFAFIDCTFSACNLSMAKLNKTAFREVKFINCKLLGLRFDTCHDFGLSFSFEGCQLDHSVFFKTKILKTSFVNTQLKGVDFTGADVSNAMFDNCDLADAVFDRTNLEKADFRTAVNYSIDPEINRMKKARFSMPGIAGLLDKYGIQIDTI